MYLILCLFVFIYIWLFILSYDFLRRLKFSWEAIYLVAHFDITRGFPSGSVVKNLPEMQELQKTWVWSLGWEDPLEEEMATHSSFLAWRIPMDRRAWQTRIHGVSRVGYDWAHTSASSKMPSYPSLKEEIAKTSISSPVGLRISSFTWFKPRSLEIILLLENS